MNTAQCWAVAVYNEHKYYWAPGILYCHADVERTLKHYECATDKEAIDIAKRKIRKSEGHVESCPYYEDPRDTL